jgi:hypothetical protein
VGTMNEWAARGGGGGHTHRLHLGPGTLKGRVSSYQKNRKEDMLQRYFSRCGKLTAFVNLLANSG